MVFRSLSISNSLNEMASASFVAVGDSVTAPYKFGDDIIIPFLDGVLFGGVVNKTKKKQVSFNTDPQKTFWQISCLGDFKYLERELVEQETRFTDELPSDILKGLIGTAWTGTIEDSATNPIILSYTPGKVSKSEAVTNILNQTGYEWRTRRPVYRLEVDSYASNVITIDTTPMSLVSGELITSIPSVVIFISGEGKYITTGKVSANTTNTITLSDGLNLDKIASGDRFIVTRHPVLDASPSFSGSSVKNLTVNKTLFDFDYELDESSKYNAICVNATDSKGDTYVSYLPAIYTVNAPGDWEDCTFINNSKSGATPDTFIVNIDRNSNTIYVDGVNSYLNLTAGEVVYVGGAAFTISSVNTSENGMTPLYFATFTLDALNIGDPVLRKTIYVNDASNIVVDGSGNADVIIGNEELAVSVNTATNVLTAVSRELSTSKPHLSGTLVRSKDALGKDGSNKVSETNPQTGSPVDNMGFVKIATADSSSVSNTGLADRLATTKLATGSLMEISGSGLIPLKYFYKADVSGLIGNTGLNVGDIVHVNNFGEVSGVTTDFRINSIEVTFDNASVTFNFGNKPQGIGDFLVNIINSIGRTS